MTKASDINLAVIGAGQRLKKWLKPTPLIKWKAAGSSNLAETRFKCENFQKTGSFKIRGALSKLTSKSVNEGASDHFITASSGNHGIASGTAAQLLGRNLTVYLPVNVAEYKVAQIRALGVAVEFAGDDSGATEVVARQEAARLGATYISPYNDPDIIAGQGTIGLELLVQMGDTPIDNVFISLGGGGLVSGIGSVLKSHNQNTKVWGVSAENSAALSESLKVGKIVEVPHLPTFADGVAGAVDADTITLGLGKEVIDQLVTCSESEIKAAFQEIAYSQGMIVEGAAALAFAGLQKSIKACAGQNNVVVLCGSNLGREVIVEHLGH